jgi:Rrf2 family protein
MISQTAEYALRAVVFLASNTDAPTSRRDIAAQTQVPNDYLMKVLQELARAGIVSSHRGPGGGYRLAVSTDDTSVFDVITAISSLPRIEACPLGIEEHIKLCPLHKRLDEAAALVEQAFKKTTISELIPNRSARSACQFPRELG